jgi:putative addiction module killer protein
VNYSYFVITVRQTTTFAAWLDGLRDRRAAERIAMRIVRLEAGLFGDTRSVGSGVSELRVDYGPGYRVYFTRRGSEIVILLCGGDKSSQSRDIKAAIKMATELE